MTRVILTAYHHVEITGALQAPLAAKLPSRSAAAAEGIRSIQVSSIKMIAAACPATKKPESQPSTPPKSPEQENR